MADSIWLSSTQGLNRTDSTGRGNGNKKSRLPGEMLQRRLVNWLKWRTQGVGKDNIKIPEGGKGDLIRGKTFFKPSRKSLITGVVKKEVCVGDFL